MNRIAFWLTAYQNDPVYELASLQAAYIQVTTPQMKAFLAKKIKTHIIIERGIHIYSRLKKPANLTSFDYWYLSLYPNS